jgi:hypothetical protein
LAIERPVRASAQAAAFMARIEQVSTERTLKRSNGKIAPGHPGQFLLKDIVLLGAAFWTLGDSLAASETR